MSSYLVQEEDGTSRFTLEDSSGFLLLEDGTTPAPTPAPSGGPGILLRPPRTHLRPDRGEITLTSYRPQAKANLTILTQTLRADGTFPVFRPTLHVAPANVRQRVFYRADRDNTQHQQRIEELLSFDDLD